MSRMVPSVASSDCAALAELANRTQLHNWTYARGWLSDPNCCDWELVGCDTAGRVTLLALSFNGLRGVLPASIARLSALQDLDLEYNALTGPLPDLSPLTQLVQLGLGGNAFTAAHPSLCSLRATRGPACDLSGNFFSCPLPDCNLDKTCQATCIGAHLRSGEESVRGGTVSRGSSSRPVRRLPVKPADSEAAGPVRWPAVRSVP